MNRADETRADILSFLLTEYPLDSSVRYLEEVARSFLLGEYNEEFVEKFWHDQGTRFREEFVSETNSRIDLGASLRYEVLDDEGEKLRGAGAAARPQDPRLAFQDALQELTPLEFERLAGVLLQWAGCHSAWLTPESHDQGLDAFGYAAFFPVEGLWPSGLPQVVFLAQAKHYIKQRVSSYDLREFVGASECAKHRIYAVQGDRYAELARKNHILGIREAVPGIK